MIYRTDFDPDTKQCTTDSSVTFYNTVDEVVTAYGEPECKTNCYAVYPGTIYSRIPWCVNPEPSFI